VSALPTPTPPFNPEAAPFWTAAAEGRLVLPRCESCGHHIWYPRTWCPVCGSDDVRWTAVSGRGTVYAVTILHRAMRPWADAAPFVVAYVELAEGPRILTNVLTDDPADVRIGDEVEAVFVPLPDQPPDAPIRVIARFALR